MINHRLHKASGEKVELSAEGLSKVKEVLTHYPEGKQKSALLPLLHIVQEEGNGFLSVDRMNFVASLLEIQPIEVYEVATFYTMFNLEPVGTYVIDVCRTGPCALCGGENILEHLKKRLNIEVGETTSDGLFTLNAVECLGACGSAPVLQVNTEFHEFMTPEKIDLLIDDLRRSAAEGKTSASKWVETF
jgi:NADH-quinone oxidoreductase subunit E